MATVIDRINQIVRVGLSDDVKSRWTDAQLLTFFKQAIRHLQGAGYKERLPFLRKKFDFTLQAGQDSYLLPGDFLVQYGVWRKDTNKPIPVIEIDDYEIAQVGEELAGYFIEYSGTSTNIVFLGPVLTNTNIRLRYYSDAFPDTLTTSSQMPWNGKLDYVICDYVTMRAFHVDRFDLSIDFGLLKELEKSMMDMFKNVEPNMAEARGVFW